MSRSRPSTWSGPLRRGRTRPQPYQRVRGRPGEDRRGAAPEPGLPAWAEPLSCSSRRLRMRSIRKQRPVTVTESPPMPTSIRSAQTLSPRKRIGLGVNQPLTRRAALEAGTKRREDQLLRSASVSRSTSSIAGVPSCARRAPTTRANFALLKRQKSLRQILSPYSASTDAVSSVELSSSTTTS